MDSSSFMKGPPRNPATTAILIEANTGVRKGGVDQPGAKWLVG